MKKKILILIGTIILLFISSHCSSFLLKKSQKSVNIEIIDEFEAQIECGEIEGIESGIIYTDTISQDTIKGFAEFIVTFDNINSLNIESVKLRRVFLRYPEKTVINNKDSRFKYYNYFLVTLFENYKCWKKKGDSNRVFSVNQSITVPFTINPCNVSN